LSGLDTFQLPYRKKFEIGIESVDVNRQKTSAHTNQSSLCWHMAQEGELVRSCDALIDK
jgi:hypothetical protein